MEKEIFQKAQLLLRASIYSDIDKIQECLADLMQIYATNELESSVNEQAYELLRTNVYLETKKAKKEGKTDMTDGDIDKFSKNKALEKYPFLESKALRNVAKTYMQMLGDLRISLLSQQKNA